MHQKIGLLCLVLGLLSMTGASPWLDPKLETILKSQEKANVMVSMLNSTKAILDSLNTRKFESRSQRLKGVAAALQQHANVSQLSMLKMLDGFTGIHVTPYWISNQVFIEGATAGVILAVLDHPGVDKLEKEFFMSISMPMIMEAEVVRSDNDTNGRQSRQNGVNTYGINLIRAPAVWNLGFRGGGVRVATIDTGVRYTHVALTARYLGNLMNHNYGWFDPNNRTLNAKPYDNVGHGTHTMGILAGSGGIGVAPDAIWMTCKGCSDTICSNNDLTACGQFIMCPTYPDGSHPNCTLAPSVVSNSWGSAGGSGFYSSVVSAWQAGGIFPVFSVGNSGPNCATAGNPGDLSNVIAVGAIDSNSVLARYSSKGPGPGGRVKPDLVAPGSAVISSFNSGDSTYAGLSGTSMAAPMVAGVIALTRSKNPTLTYLQTYQYLANSAVRSGRTGGKTCNSIPVSSWPNNSFGYGRVDALNAINAIATPV